MMKRYFSAVTALILCGSMAGCGSSADSKESSSYVEAVKVATTDAIESIPEGADNELEWFSYFDLNPSENSPEKNTNLALFEQKGGKIKYSQTTSLKKYDDLASRLMADNPPDMFWYETGMTFPANCIKGMFQPVDSIVDFDSAIWSDVKDTAAQYTLNGEHYVTPVSFGALSVMAYDKSIIESAGLDDPYELYQEGKWDWDNWYDMMAEYCDGATDGEERWGVNGWFAPFIFHSTGKTIISYDADKDEYVSNIYDADLERAANLLYNVRKNDYYNASWIGSASQAFKQKVLFYAMGTWAVSPKEGDNWGIVPMPKDPNTDELYTTLAVNAYMWVKGSTKSEAMKCWLECARIVESSDEYKQTNKDKFMVNQPYWTEEMYQIANEEVISDKFNRLFDAGYGISSVLSDNDAATNPTKEAVIPYLYTSVMKNDEDDSQFTWSQLRESYKSTIDSELKTFNEAYHKFIGK